MSDTKIIFLGAANDLIQHAMDVNNLSGDPVQMIEDAVDRARIMAIHGKHAIAKVVDADNLTSSTLEKTDTNGRVGWKGVPRDLDAALIHPKNKKAYFFKGINYYRYDFSQEKVDKTDVVGNSGWKKLHGYFDATLVHPGNQKAYFFVGRRYYRYDFDKHIVDNLD